MAENYPIESIPGELEEHFNWFNKASVPQKDRLKHFLLNLDKSNKTDMECDRSKKIIQDVNQIMHTISKRLEERQSAFSGKLVLTGSSKDGTKIGQPDEFDFVYEMDGIKLLNGIGKFVHVKNENSFAIQFEDGRDLNYIEYLVLDENSRVCFIRLDQNHAKRMRDIASRNPDGFKASSIETITDIFQDILKEVLTELELPSDWNHGGFNRPNFSGLRNAGPAYLLQFDYLTKDDGDHLRLSVDFVPMIPVHDQTEQSFLHTFLKDFPRPDYHWLSVAHRIFGCVYYGHDEAEWLSRFSGSMSKTLVRIFKILNDGFKKPEANRLSPDFAEVIVNIMKQKKQGHIIKPSDLPVLIYYQFAAYTMDNIDDYAGYSDLGEIGSKTSLVNSHHIKKGVMTMMAVDESHGLEWTEDDLPDLVVCFCMVITKLFKTLVQPIREIKIEKFSVPLDNLYQTTESNSLPPQPGKTVSKATVEASKFITSILSSVHPDSKLFDVDNKDAYDIAIVSLLRVFRWVCEGDETAHLELLKHTFPAPINPLNPDIRPKTKIELEEMMRNLAHVTVNK